MLVQPERRISNAVIESLRLAPYVNLETIEGERPSLDDVIGVLRRFPLESVVWIITRINYSLEKNYLLDPIEVQKKLLGHLCSAKLLKVIDAQHKVLDGPPPMRFFHEAQLMTALKLALLHCKDSVEVAPTGPMDDLVRVLLGVNSHLRQDGPDDSDDDSVLRDIFVNLAFSHEDHWPTEMARWECLIKRIPAQMTGDRRYFDCPTTFQRATGCDLEQHRAFAGAAYTSFSRLQDQDLDRRQVLHLQKSSWLHQFEVPSSDAQLYASIAAQPDQVRSELKASGNLALAPYYYLPLQKHPVIDIRGRLWCRSLRMLGKKLGPGIYHAILTYLIQQRDGAVDKQARETATSDLQRFADFRGVVFEKYVGDILDRVSGGMSPRKLFRPDKVQSDSCGRKCDFILMEGKRAIVIEAKSRLFLLESLAAGTIDCLRRDFEQMVLGAAAQMDETISDIESGALKIEGLRPWDIDVYLPLVCTLDFVPAAFTVDGWLRDEVNKRSLLGGRKVAPLQVMDIGSCELLEPHLLADKSLSDLIIKKNLGDVTRGMLFWNFIQDEHMGQLPNSFLWGVVDELKNEMTTFWSERKRSRNVQGEMRGHLPYFELRKRGRKNANR